MAPTTVIFGFAGGRYYAIWITIHQVCCKTKRCNKASSFRTKQVAPVLTPRTGGGGGGDVQDRIRQNSANFGRRKTWAASFLGKRAPGNPFPIMQHGCSQPAGHIPSVNDRAESTWLHCVEEIVLGIRVFLHRALPRSHDRTKFSDPNKISPVPRFHQLTNVLLSLSVTDSSPGRSAMQWRRVTRQ